jgi:hypothetical protein
MPDGADLVNTIIKTLNNGAQVKIIDIAGDPYQMHLHPHPGGWTMSLYDKATGKPALNFDGTPQRFTWPSSDNG